MLMRLLSYAQLLDLDGSGKKALESLPRKLQQQLQEERKAGGVQHLLDMLRQIEVRS